MSKQIITLQVADVREIAPQVRHIAFKRTDGQVLEFQPGQFITLLLSDADTTIRRNYSIATIPPDPSAHTAIDTIEIALTYVPGGIASEQLFAIKPGDCLQALSPSGRLLLREDDKPQRFVLVATGTGVTPYRAMLPQLAERLAQQDDLSIVLLFGVRTPQHVLYAQDFAAFAKTHPRFIWHCCYSRELPSEAEPNAHKGYVQHLLKEMPLSPRDDLVYLCGNPTMVDEAYSHLKEQNFAIEHVRREKYISPRTARA